MDNEKQRVNTTTTIITMPAPPTPIPSSNPINTNSIHCNDYNNSLFSGPVSSSSFGVAADVSTTFPLTSMPGVPPLQTSHIHDDQLPIAIPAEYFNTSRISGSSAVGLDGYLRGGGGGHDASGCGGGAGAGNIQPAFVHNGTPNENSCKFSRCGQDVDVV